MLTRLITGICLIFIGLILLIVSLMVTDWLLIYAIPLLIIGVVILFNTGEDQIEQRRDMKGGKK